MNFDIPADLVAFLAEIDAFIERVLRPIEQADDNIRFFDHRREDARTDWERGGLPNAEWEALLARARRLADDAGFYRYLLPAAYGGRNGTNLGMAIIREHLAHQGLGLHCDLQNEHAIVSNHVGLLLMIVYGSAAQQEPWLRPLLAGERCCAFGITEPDHGSDATHMETHALREGDHWRINGEKTWNTGIHLTDHDLIFARTAGKAGDGQGITAFLVPTDHARVSLQDVRVPHSAIFGREGHGLAVVQHFFNENRIRPAASSLGGAQYCIDQSVECAKWRKPFGKPLAASATAT